MKKALITGISGQDGSYLSELLLEKGYEVHGLVRREALEDPAHRMPNIAHLVDNLVLHPGSIESYPTIFELVKKAKPDEVYHLAAKSYVSFDFEDEFTTIDTNIHSTHYLLATISQSAPDARFYFAGSSEMFGNVSNDLQDENTIFNPRSAYGISKVASYHLLKNYRERHKLHASCGILYNHESPRRGHEFVTRKIVSNAVRIKKGLDKNIQLGDLSAIRDWGHSKDYVRAMWLMLQQDNPDDYVIATGKTHSVEDLCNMVFSNLGMNYKDYVQVNQKHIRPTTSTHTLRGNPAKAEKQLGWTRTYSFEQMIQEMVEAELKRSERL
jgi:GDPmannose 4,6-dehydratase